ncbi:hypothetical protein H7K45_28590 [Mycobacterium yunnanensis]|uniref:Cupin domain-containing protein n=1 Tax=Mycobacterium yunnanensis TaxID=368477 RepID=A0A9X3C3J8_9MYCO|nr:hypothetical protein [Mycobacterium yunnanensis]
MIRTVRLWTGEDGRSHFEAGHIDLAPGPNSEQVSNGFDVVHSSFSQTGSGGSLGWHTAPTRQLVVTLGGTPSVTTPDGRSVRLGPGDVMLAEDTTGSGHRWQLEEGGQPWQRLYVVLGEGADVPFIAAES